MRRCSASKDGYLYEQMISTVRSNRCKRNLCTIRAARFLQVDDTRAPRDPPPTRQKQAAALHRARECAKAKYVVSNKESQGTSGMPLEKNTNSWSCLLPVLSTILGFHQEAKVILLRSTSSSIVWTRTEYAYSSSIFSCLFRTSWARIEEATRRSDYDLS